MPIRLNDVQKNPALAKAVTTYLATTREEANKALRSAFKRANDAAKKGKKKSTKKTGFVTVSNTDSVNRCAQLKARLNAKLGEIYASDLDEKTKSILSRDIMMQLDKVEQKIAEIHRRQRAIKEERAARKTDQKHDRQRRRHDMTRRTASIRRDYLYSAEDGGMDPAEYGPPQINTEAAAVSFNIAGETGEAAGSAEAPAAAFETTA